MKTKKNPSTGKPYKYHWAVYAAREQSRYLHQSPAGFTGRDEHLPPILSVGREFV